ncbi:kinesin-like protein [Mycena pura]|uniref:Kinesin-like protein n=1 Tax=Mycena pura TaxID=153505 RepID=A0AAD6V7D8_9AGAR|nr:kinesin-like protein [Mycena pura]
MSVAKVKVIARLRPRLPGEPLDDGIRVCHREPANVSSCSNPGSGSANVSLNANSSSAIGANSSGNSSGSGNGGGSFTGIAVNNPRDPSQVFRFPFTNAYGADATQEAIFEADVRPLIDVACSGVTVTIFAYGVTSSGKTYTMQGTSTHPGVIPRVVEALFDKTSSSSKPEIAVSYMEIYKDDVYDLLVARENAAKLPVRENDAGMVFVAGLVSTPVASAAEFDALFATSTSRRSVGATRLNDQSSRSHAVLTLNIRTHVGDRVREGKINLVDLAGSENNKQTGNDQSRMAESKAINTSLSALGMVVHALNTGASRIPYRNSKLTRLLQDALGGSSVGLLICNLAPSAKFRQDTLNTLNFAVRTKNIENKPVVNERDVHLPQPLKIDFAQLPAPLPASKPVTTLPAPSRAGARLSLVPRPAARVSGFGFQGSRLSIVGNADTAPLLAKTLEKAPLGLSEEEIDARISRAVEAEVARRLEEREKEMEREQEQQRQRERELENERERQMAGPSQHKSGSPKVKKQEFSRALSSLLKHHKDLDDGLEARLKQLERKFERGSKEVDLADMLSPVSKKKTGRAFVALARSHQENHLTRGDLQKALDLYRQAETYVPDNIKLKERWILFLVHVFLWRVAHAHRKAIIEIEWAVKNRKPFKPSPKRKKKSKKGRTTNVAETEMDVDGNENAAPMSDEQMEVDEVETSLTGRVMGGFAAELTNTGSKRSFTDMEMEMGTPAKRPKRGAAIKARLAMVVDDGDDQLAAPRKNRRRIGET